MNKKILFLILAEVLILPLVGQAQALSTTIPELDRILDNIGFVVTGIGSALIVIGFVVAGVMYLTSAGSTEKMGTAKKAFIAALIGAVIVILATTAGTLINIIQNILGI